MDLLIVGLSFSYLIHFTNWLGNVPLGDEVKRKIEIFLDFYMKDILCCYLNVSVLILREVGRN